MKRWLLIALFIVVALSIGSSTPATAARDTVVVKIAKSARLAEDGQSAQLKVRVRCPAGLQTLEGFVYITQDGNQSTFGPLNPVCDGKRHKLYVTVNAQGTLFARGQAQASAYLLLLDPETQNTITGDATQTLTLKHKLRSGW